MPHQAGAHLVAHRGFHVAALENSVEAVRAAAGAGATMVEIDVQETADGQLVVLHDMEVAGVEVATLTAGALRARLPAGAAPLLRDVLGATPLALDVEIKRADPAKVVAELVRSGRGDGCVITSFDAGLVAGARAAGGGLACGLLVGAREVGTLDDAGVTRALLGRAAAADAVFLALEAPLARRPVLAAVAENLAPSLVWIVNDAALARRLLADPAVSGVVTDRPDLVRAG